MPESAQNHSYQMLCLMQHENTLADHGNEISTKIIQICLANGLESIIRAFPSIVTKKDTVSQWLSILRLIINGTPQVADQICKTLNNTSMKQSYLAPILTSSEQYIQKKLHQRKMQIPPGGRSNSNVDMKKANQDDEILNQYIGVLAKLCKSDHFIDNNMNTIRRPLEMVEDDHKIEICNRLNGDMWGCIYDYIRKMSFANNVQKITRMQKMIILPKKMI